MKRLMLLLTIVCLVLFGTALVAGAVTAPKITIDKVEPKIPAVGGGGTSIELRNPAEELTLLDETGQPWLRINQNGVTEKDSKGQWQEVRKESFYYVTETEVGRFVTSKQALPYPWHMNGTYGGRPFIMEGTYVPPGGGQNNSSGILAGAGVLLGLAVAAVLVIAGGIYGIVVLVQRKRR